MLILASRQMVLNRLTLILVCPCTYHPPIRPLYCVHIIFLLCVKCIPASSSYRILVYITTASDAAFAFLALRSSTSVNSMLLHSIRHKRTNSSVENNTCKLHKEADLRTAVAKCLDLHSCKILQFNDFILPQA